MWFIKRYNDESLVSLSLLIPKILHFFTKRDGIMDRQTDNPNAIQAFLCPLRAFTFVTSGISFEPT